MLDDLKLIHERDAQDALGIAEKEPAQLTTPIALSGNRQFADIRNVVYGGMGGSALAALLLHTWPKLAVPFEVVRDYDLPDYVDKHTLVIVASYSGNTEETLSTLEQAEARNAQIAVIAGGGHLQGFATAKGYLFAPLPTIGQPRYAVLANLRALIQILEVTGLVDKSVWPRIDREAEVLHVAAAGWRPDVPTAKNLAKQIAQELVGKSVVVYAGPKLFPAAYKWKISMNENAKQIAWCNQYPELNHNEFIGWTKQPVDKPYAVVELRSSLEHSRTQKRFELTDRLLSGMRPSPIVVAPEGETVFEQLVWAVMLGDFVSIYLAILNGVNPTPVDLIEKFKRELAA